MMGFDFADISLGIDFAAIIATTLYIVSLLVRTYGGRLTEGELPSQLGICSEK